MAALQVVARRLAAAGLGDFCLELHSQDASKATIVRDLDRALRAEASVRDGVSDSELQRLETLRNELNAYVRVLHSPDNPLGLSPFRAHGEIAARAGAPVVHFGLPDVGSLSIRDIQRLRDVIQRVATFGSIVLREDDHPWFGYVPTTISPADRAQLSEQLQRLAAAVGEVRAAQDALRNEWGLPQAPTLADARWLRDLVVLLRDRPNVPVEWFSSTPLAPLVATADDWARRVAEHDGERAELLERYTEGIFDLDLDTLERELGAVRSEDAEHVRGEGAPDDRAFRSREALRTSVNRAADSLSRTAEIGTRLAQRLGVPLPTTLDEVERVHALGLLVLNDPRPQPDWFDLTRRIHLQELAEEAGRHQDTVNALSAALSEAFDDGFWGVVTPDLVSRFEESYGSWIRWFDTRYWRDLRLLRDLRRSGSALGQAEAMGAIQDARRITSARAWLDRHHDTFAAAFPAFYTGEPTDWSAVAAALDTVHRIDALLRAQPSSQLQAILSERRGLEGLRQLVRSAGEGLAEVEAHLESLSGLVSLEDVPIADGVVRDAPLDLVVGWLRDWIASFARSWSAAETLLACVRGPEPSVSRATTDLRVALRIRSVEIELSERSEHLRAQFGHLFTGSDTRWPDVLHALAWTRRIINHFDQPPPESFVAAHAAGRAVDTHLIDKFRDGIADTEQGLELLRPKFSNDGFRIGMGALDAAPLTSIACWVDDKRNAMSRLEELVDCRHALAEAESAGLGAFVHAVRRGELEPSSWVDAFLRQVYTLWLSWRYETVPALDRFRGQRHEELVAEFGRLDELQWHRASERIVRKLQAARPRVSSTTNPRSEPGILQREAIKRRRFKPLRKLFAQLPHLLPALKPCLLMSPLSVARYLGESPVEFDVVIFDEASQIVPADAIGAIGRGRQMIVVGDRQQLPPTRFFSVAAEPDADQDDAEDVEVPESILDACAAAGLPTKRLSWHYRSRHEDLIAFSNKHFYDRGLVTFPSPYEDYSAVEYVHIEAGAYDRAASGANRVEARAIAALVEEHVRSHPAKTLGVITFSEKQMFAVETELDGLRRGSPELEEALGPGGPEPFFVKNLENVQGDERDVILFSVGYGPDHAGRMTMNFGPLNRSGGERRLNVAVTRAREHVKILASFHPKDIDLGRTKARGVQLLREYLEFAQQGRVALLDRVVEGHQEPESPFEEAVALALSTRGLELVSQVGVGGFRIDFGVRDGSSPRYLLGIECDGATYHSSRTARDRDRLRQQILEGLGWRIHRIWSTDWIKDPEREIQKVLTAVELARQAGDRAPSQPHEQAVAREVEVSGDAETQDVLGENRPDSPPARRVPRSDANGARPYVHATLARQGSPEIFELASRVHIATLVQDCVDQEGPVHRDRVVRAVARAYGIARVGSRIRSRVAEAIDHVVRGRRVDQRDTFLWPRNFELQGARGPDARGYVRNINEIPPEEIAMATAEALATEFSIGKSDLVTAVARRLGFDRTGAQVSSSIGRVIDRMISEGGLRETGGQITLEHDSAPPPSAPSDAWGGDHIAG